MGIKIPNTNFGYNSNLILDDEDEAQDGVFDLEIDPEKLGDLGNLGKKPEKRDLAPDDVVEMLAGPPPGWKPKYTSRKKQQEEEEPPKEEEPQGLFDDVTDIDARQERERQAFADELAARKAEEIQRTEARAGLGGMGLSGATSELVGDVSRQAERAGDIAMADLGRRQQKETFDELRRQASIWTFEEEFGVDLDGDGNYGAPPEELPPPPQNDQDDESTARDAGSAAALTEEGQAKSSLTENLLETDENASRGSQSNPIVVDSIDETPEDARWAKDDQGKFLFDENGRQLLVDSQGRYYAV